MTEPPDWQETLDDLDRRRQRARAMGGPERLAKHRDKGKLDARGSCRMRASFLVPAGVITTTEWSSTANQTGSAIGMPSRRRVVRIPVCADSTASHASSTVNRMLIAPLPVHVVGRPLAVYLSQTLQ